MMACLVVAILFLLVFQAQGGLQNDLGLSSNDRQQVPTSAISDDIRKQLQDVRFTLEKFNTHYLINLEQRMMNILTTMTSLDSNIKSLQEKAQVWDVFQHHIGAWNDHIKSVDQKMELLKKAHESTPPALETRLSNLDFKVQHVFDKVDTINEKLHDITKTVYALSSANRARRNDRESTDQAAVMTKISSLQKQLNRLESTSANCQKKNGNGIGGTKVKKEVQEFEDEVDDFLDKLATKKLKDIAANRKHGRTLDSLTNLLRTVDERTVRIYDLEANQFEQILSCCKRTDREITTFTNSADILLKRIERLVINVDAKIETRNLRQCERNSSMKVEDDVVTDLGSGEGAVPTTTEKDYKAIEIEIDEPEVSADFHQPNKQGCHQLTIRQNGVYTFGEVELNEANRDFNRRYCYFATDGPAWTVIQRRKLDDLQENFNRSWNEYKYGFGDLGHEFWLGNDFINTLTYDDNVELRVELWDFEGNSAWAEFKTFRIDSERFNYNLMVSEYHGNASDAMSYHNDQDFSTFDRANDKSNGSFACALTYGSGWWFNSCAESNLNGIYYADDPKLHKSTGILWETWLGDYSLKESAMMIRSREVWTTEGEPQDP